MTSLSGRLIGEKRNEIKLPWVDLDVNAGHCNAYKMRFN